MSTAGFHSLRNISPTRPISDAIFLFFKMDSRYFYYFNHINYYNYIK